jgi:hypothetical protein
MAVPQPPDPVKLFVAILWADAGAMEAAVQLMQTQWGPIDFTGPDRPFDVTDYYVAEMGAHLKRRIVTFQHLFPLEAFVETKLICNKIENQLAAPSGRRVNLDVGYLDHNKIVLASAKSAGQKMYLGIGIYGDLVGRYAHGRYQPFEWTFPDFKDGRYDPEFETIRRAYLEQLRGAHRQK